MGAMWDYRRCVWDYRESTWTVDSDLVGYEIEVADGRLGTVARSVSGPADCYLVVDTASRPGGRRLVPAHSVTSLCHPERVVRLDLTADQLTRAPVYDGEPWDDGLRAKHESYFSTVGC